VIKWGAYWRLMRFDKPTGIALLWAPTGSALWLANHGAPTAALFTYFLLGTIVMRALGCVINDIADRHVDIHVSRTRMRPLTTGEVGLGEAYFLLIGLLFAAFFIVVQLPKICFYYALIALCITFFYPFCKRFINTPQLVLSVAFSLSIPMAFAASGVAPNLSMLLLFGLSLAWIVAYDTMYAMIDREDDLKIGVKSTAVLFAAYDRVIIGLLQVFFHSLWLLLALTAPLSKLFYISWVMGAFLLVYQQWLLGRREQASYLRAFLSNGLYGIVMWVGLLL